MLAVVYLVLYEVVGFSVAPIVTFAGEPGTASYVLVFFAGPVLLGCLLSAIFGASVGWLRGLFARQPIVGRGWMWIAVAVALLFNVLHMFSIDYDAAGLDYVFT
ncbi:hypothetical protein [Microbacterium sp. RG1]|uniref:hypothetical protein n=1 Tax=Microbacterium sp. RG1 TaxID=2489212 RepID=UPI0010CA6217|nr:hypothetical protein [Microbacterium sp. RG1]QCQ16647.1 hypothetical protein EHF32_07905 [Microbacterium sp. RG1]